tara:strand:- start:48 stop:482 length:435 start_codon:yes stop_codon:yes gene_type:complete
MAGKHYLGIEYLSRDSGKWKVSRILELSFENPIYVGKSYFEVQDEPGDLSKLLQMDGSKISIANWKGVTDSISSDHFMLEWDSRKKLYKVTLGRGKAKFEGEHTNRSLPESGIHYLSFTKSKIIIPPLHPTFRFSPKYISNPLP